MSIVLVIFVTAQQFSFVEPPLKVTIITLPIDKNHQY